MKKSSKLISLLLALVLATSCFAGFSAFTATAAEEAKIYFKLPEDVWGESHINENGLATSVYCHLYAVYGDSEMKDTSWQSKSEKCFYDEATGLYYFDLVAKKRTLKEGADYALLFSTDTTTGKGHQTGNVTLSTECYGATVIVTGNMIENTEDSTKLDYEAVWDDAELSTKYGPKAAITSKGNIVGSYFPVYQPKEQIVSQFICSWAVLNASIITPEIVQNDCAALGVDPMDVYNQYATDYAEQLADPAKNPNVAPLETVAYLLGVDPTATTEPETTEPVTTEPVTTEPVTTEPVTTEPVTTEPVTTEPVTTEPETTEPVTTEPVTTEPTYMYGDVNMDGKISVLDATLIQKIGIGMVQADATVMTLADVNGDGRVSIFDVTYVQKYIADLGYNTAKVGQPAEL